MRPSHLLRLLPVCSFIDCLCCSYSHRLTLWQLPLNTTLYISTSFIYLFILVGGGICFLLHLQFPANACAVTSFSSSSLYHRDMKPSLLSHQALIQIHYIDYIEMFPDFSLSGSSCRALTHATATDDDAPPTLSVNLSLSSKHK